MLFWLSLRFFLLLLRCVCLDDKERWTTPQLLKHSFLNPQPKAPLMEQSPEGESVTTLDNLLDMNFF